MDNCKVLCNYKNKKILIQEPPKFLIKPPPIPPLFEYDLNATSSLNNRKCDSFYSKNISKNITTTAKTTSQILNLTKQPNNTINNEFVLSSNNKINNNNNNILSNSYLNIDYNLFIVLLFSCLILITILVIFVIIYLYLTR